MSELPEQDNTKNDQALSGQVEPLVMLTNEDIVKLALAHRYLYYVLMRPVITDSEYDKLEMEAVEAADDDDSDIHSPGSDLEGSYTDDVKKLAMTILKQHNAEHNLTR